MSIRVFQHANKYFFDLGPSTISVPEFPENKPLLIFGSFFRNYARGLIFGAKKRTPFSPYALSGLFSVFSKRMGAEQSFPKISLWAFMTILRLVGS